MKARTDADFHGADISSYQSITNPDQFFTDFSFVYFRAFGAYNKETGGDPKFKEFVDLAKKHGVPSGAYYFATPDPTKAANATDLKNDAEAQAAEFITKLQEVYGTGKYGDLIPMLDVEAWEHRIGQQPPPLEELRDNAFYLTSLMETSTYREDFPHMHGVTSGNFDGAGVSHGAIQWNFKSKSLQPILIDLINNHNALVRDIFGTDYDEFYDVVINRTVADQIAWGESISNPTNKHQLIDPWAGYFYELGTTPQAIERQKAATIDYHNQAKRLFDKWGLWTRRGYALAFDIAVQSWAPNATAETNIANDFAAMTTTGKTDEDIETEKMLIIANRVADQIDISWRESYRERKTAIANGSGYVYGSLLVDTVPYEMILEPAFVARDEAIWGYPYAGGMTGTQLKDWILAFRNYFRATTGGRAVGLYTNRSFLTDASQMAMSAADLQELAIMPLWLAEWNSTAGFQPANLGGWTNYNVWQYDMIADASDHGVSHGQNQLDHNVTQDLALIMPPKPPTNVKLTQLTNTSIRVTFTEPTDSDYIGSDIYLNGKWAAWLQKGIATKDLTVTTPIGGQLQINVVSQDRYQDTSWSGNAYLTMIDMETNAPPPETPSEIINYEGRAAGDESRKIMVNGLSSIELTPTMFGAEWWNYPAIAAEDGSYMSYTATDADGDKVQFLFQFEVAPGQPGTVEDPGSVERLEFRIKGKQGQPFTLKFWNHSAAAWDENTVRTFDGSADAFLTITTENIAEHVGSDNRVYLSMLSVNSVVNPAAVYSSRNYPINWLTAIRQSNGAIVSTSTPLYTGGSSGLASYLGIDRTEILNDIQTSRLDPKIFLKINGTIAGFARLGFHDLTTQPTVAAATAPAIAPTATTLNTVTGWQSWDISIAAKDNLASRQGFVVYANANEASAQAYGATGDANAIVVEVQGDWQQKVDVPLGADYAELLVYRGEPVPPPPPKPEPVEQPPDELTYDYTDQDVLDMLHGKTGSRFVRFRFDLLDVNEIKIRELKNVLSAEVSMNSFNTIKKTARFTIREDDAEQINFLRDRIAPFIEFKLPDKFVQNADGSRVLLAGPWVEFPMGVFLLSSPKRSEQGAEVYRDVEAYDGIVILEEDKFLERYTVKAGTKYTDAIIDVLTSAGITKYNIDFSDKVLASDVEYEPGTEKTKPISDFLSAINFSPIWVDEYGYFRATKYISPADREPDYIYQEDEFSVIANGVEEELDLYSVPNSWVAVYTSTDSTSQNMTFLTSSYLNDNPDSPTSTVSRGRTIVDYRKVNEIADQEALDEYVRRIAFEASQIFGKVRFDTAIMPFHGFQDVIYLVNSRLGIDAKFAETAWKISLKAGALMTHEARIVTNI